MSERIHLKDLISASIRLLPDSPTALRGLWNLARIQHESLISIGSLIEDHAAATPEAIALSFEEKCWNYYDFNAWANRLAGVLSTHGVKAGDRVAILMENRPETLAMVTAVVKLGAVAGMLNHAQRGKVLEHSLKLLDARLLVLGAECQTAIDSMETPLDNSVPVLWSGEGKMPKGMVSLAKEIKLQPAHNPKSTSRVKASDVAFYIFTSGTTGLPKASRMTHYRWLRGMAGLSQMAMRLKPTDVVYCCLPLYHNNALTVSWGAALGAGATLALSKKFSASRFWDEVRAHQATCFTYIGELLRYLLNQPTKPGDKEHDVRIIMGNGLRAEIWQAFEERFGITDIREFYGASEGNAAFVNAFGARGTAGFSPLSYAIVAFDADAETPERNKKGYLKKVGAGGVGLLLTEVTDRAPFDGYTDAKASEGKLLRNVFKKGDVWFNTGDLVRDQGWRHIQFVDRVGDTFRWKGENVSTTEVEGALALCTGVAQGVVYGVEVQGADGRAGMAALTLGEGMGFDGKRLAEELCARLPAYAVPVFVRLQPQVETTGTFKYRKVDLKREGYDPRAIGEPLYVLSDRQKGYQPLSKASFAAIGKGAVKL